MDLKSTKSWILLKEKSGIMECYAKKINDRTNAQKNVNWE